MPNYNHTPGDSPLNPCRECFDLQTNDERWAALADAGNDESWRAKATDLRGSLGVATATLRYLHGVLANVVDARNVAKSVADDIAGDQRRVQARSDAEVATATFRGRPPAATSSVVSPFGLETIGRAILNSSAPAGMSVEEATGRAAVALLGDAGVRFEVPPAPDPRGGPFPPSTRGTQQPDGSRTWSTGEGTVCREKTDEEMRDDLRKLFERAFRTGWDYQRGCYGIGLTGDKALAAALKEEGLA